MKRIYALSLVLAIITCTYSCSKDDGSNNTKTPKEYLMAGEWKKSEYKENGVVTPFFGECEMDDVITFAADGNYTLHNGANQCSYYTGTSTDFYLIETDNKTMRWGLYGVGEISFNSTYTSFTFKKTGANTFEYIFVKK